MRNYNNYADMITFTRASSGTALAKISYGPELVTNGTFDTASDWALTTGATISGGEGVFTAATTSNGFRQNILELGKIYKIDFDVTEYTAGAVRPYAGNSGTGTSVTAVGSYSQILVCSGSTDLAIISIGTTTAKIDNVSVKKILYDQPDGTLQLFNHPTNQPRVEYDYQGNRLGLLVEEARTNYNTDSQITSGGWVTVRSSLDTSEGTLFLDKSIAPRLKEDSTTANTHHIQDISTFGSASAIAVFSVFVKKPDLNYRDYVVLRIIDDPAGSPITYTVVFDASDGSFQDDGSTGSPTSTFYGSTQYPDGWVRIWLGFTKGGGATRTDGQIALSRVSTVDAAGTLPLYNGDNASGLYVCGAQMEQGSFPTSYIPTSGSTVTRADDSITLPDSSKIWNNGAGTFVATFDYTDPANTNNNYVLGGSANARVIYNNTGNNIWQSYDGASTTFYDVEGDSSVYKLAVSVKESATSTTAKNGLIIGTRSGSALMSELAASGAVAVGGGSSSQRLNGHISSIAYYPRRLTDAQIQKLTQVKAVPTLSLTFDGNSDSYLETSIHG